MCTLVSPRALLVLLTIGLIAPACPARADSNPASPPAPATIAVSRGVIIAHGNELPSPFTLAVENDTLRIYDASGRRFTTSSLTEGATGTSALPRPRLLSAATDRAAPRPAGSSPRDDEAPVPRPLRPEIQMAQIAHLLATGGAVAFGQSYLIALPPTSAAEALPSWRWIAEHAVTVSGHLPQANPFFRDLLWPARLAPAPSPIPGEQPTSSEMLEETPVGSQPG